jgi:hypothetical protein
MAIDRVIDYEAKGMSDKPRRLHRADCIHPSTEHAKFRRATKEELSTLQECGTCVAREQANNAPPAAIVLIAASPLSACH